MSPDGLRGRAVAALVLLAGCGGAKAEPPASVEVPPARPGPRPTPAPSAPARKPEGVQVPGAVACVFAVAGEGPRALLPMRLAPGGPIFATTGTSEARVFVEAEGEGAVVEAEGDFVLVRGHLAPGDAPVWPARPFVIGGFLRARAGTKLAWRGAGPGRIGVALEEASGLALPGGPVEAERPCADVDFSPRRFLSSRPFPASPGEAPARLEAGRRIPLSLLPGRPPVAFLSSDGVAREVTSLEAEGSSTRIRGSLQEVDYFGWVPTADLGGAPGRPRPRSRAPRPRVFAELRAFAEPKGERVACRADLPLVARVGGASAVVGHLRAGSVALLAPGGAGGTGDFAPVLLDTELALAEGAEFALRSVDVRRACGKVEASGRSDAPDRLP